MFKCDPLSKMEFYYLEGNQSFSFINHRGIIAIDTRGTNQLICEVLYEKKIAGAYAFNHNLRKNYVEVGFGSFSSCEATKRSSLQTQI